jgi:cbb3-type cytochrome oxidase subunit 3
MENTKSAILKSVLLVVFGALVVLGLYFLFTRNKGASDEENYQLTVVDEITTTNLEKNYPASPKMVVEMYSKIMQTLYKETYTDEQEEKMIAVLAGLMDDELLANQANLTLSMKNEVAERKKEDYGISVYTILTKDPEVTTVDGRKMTSIDCLYTLRKSSTRILLYYQFIMRQDDSGKWKILGWTAKENNEG